MGSWPNFRSTAGFFSLPESSRRAIAQNAAALAACRSRNEHRLAARRDRHVLYRFRRLQAAVDLPAIPGPVQRGCRAACPCPSGLRTLAGTDALSSERHEAARTTHRSRSLGLAIGDQLGIPLPFVTCRISPSLAT